jgi:DNA invertase Pin-like site-specific DNA recombinase
VLVVTKLDRLTRSVADFEAILRRSERGGWNVIILDMGGHMLDTSTAMGKMHVQMLAVFAEFERASISERTRAGLAVVKANGKQLGRPTTISDAARGRILELRDAGLSWQAIADRLDADGVPGANGGRWTPITVRRQHKRALDLRPVQ